MVAAIRFSDESRAAKYSFARSVTTAPSADGWMTPSRSSRWSEYPDLVDRQVHRLAQPDDPHRGIPGEPLDDVDVPCKEVELARDPVDEVRLVPDPGGFGFGRWGWGLGERHVTPSPAPTPVTSTLSARGRPFEHNEWDDGGPERGASRD